MFFQILFAVVKGLLEMDGFVIRGEQPVQKTDSADCCKPPQQP